MSLCGHILLMAKYNEWMNAKLYETASKLPPDEFARDRGAFFGSVLGTLNHIMVADILWLKRFAGHPAGYRTLEPLRGVHAPAALNEILHGDFASLSQHRRALDATIGAWAGEIAEADLEHVLDYTNTRGVRSQKRFASLVFHFFNHQSHHRGQASTLLFQAGLDVGVTDLLAVIPNEPAAP